MQHSIFASTIRSFFISLSALLGVGLGLFLIIFFFVLLFGGVDEEMKVKTHYNPTIVANAEDVRQSLSQSAPVIMKINIGGLIGTDRLNTHSIRQQLVESREGVLKNNRVKALLIHLNTPGGTVIDSDGIYQAIKEYKEHFKVPVYAYVDGICASGGMYVAAAADKIYASDVSIIGSIGVLSPPFFNLSQLMEKVGIEGKTLFAGKGKDDLNPFRPWKPGEDAHFQTLLDDFYQQFVQIIVENRPEVSRSRLVNDYGANVFPASKAVEYGFIDGVDNSLNDTIKQLAKEVGIEDDYYQVVKMERKFWLSQFFAEDSPLMNGVLRHNVELIPELDAKMMNQFLYLYLPNFYPRG
ncbi:MAG: S49 family peptidase [Waddliaceae bacterium]